MPAISEEIRESVKLDYLSGKFANKAELARAYGIGADTLSRWVAQGGWDSPESLSQDVARRLAITAESMHVTHYRIWHLITRETVEQLNRSRAARAELSILLDRGSQQAADPDRVRQLEQAVLGPADVASLAQTITRVQAGQHKCLGLDHDTVAQKDETRTTLVALVTDPAFREWQASNQKLVETQASDQDKTNHLEQAVDYELTSLTDRVPDRDMGKTT